MGGRSGAFFFSSRRRHTRCSRDWSSDVCSSDLVWRRGAQAAVMVSGNGCAHVYFRPRGGPPTPRSGAAVPSDLVEQLLGRSEEHTSELQSRLHLVCRLLLEKKKKKQYQLHADGT